MRSIRKSLCLFVVFVAGTVGVKAQVAKEVFNTAVDHVNCETIQFIHREAGRAEAANNMDCLSFESIYNSIPKDEAATTGALCKNINEYKNKYSDSKPLDAQLNAVIAFANAKISAKKRKGNVDDFKANLEKIKQKALSDAKAGGNAAPESATGTKPADGTATKPAAASDTGQAISEPAATDNTGKSGKKTDWLGLLALIVGIDALGLAYMAYTKAKKTEGSSAHPASYTLGNKATKDEAMQEIMRLEKHFKGEIANLNRAVEELMKKEQENPAFPEAQSRPEEKASAYIQIPQEPEPEPDNAEPEPELMAKPEQVVSELHTEPDLDLEPDNNAEQPWHMEEHTAAGAMESQAPEPLKETQAGGLFGGASADLFGNSAPRAEEPARSTAMETMAPAPVMEPPSQTKTTEPEPFMPEKEYEDGEAVPFYKYAGLPDGEGNFEDGSFTDEPGTESVYEIEMYEDVPNKAFFSIRSNPDIIRKAIENPGKYLAPCCTYTGESTGKHAIVLIEEGMLRKENGQWVVYEKAKIGFE